MAMSGLTNLPNVNYNVSRLHCKLRETHRPPRKCLPLNHLTNGFGAVKLTSAAGLKSFPGPESGGPDSMFHEEGASTEVTHTLDLANASMTGPNGSLTSPVKLKPIQMPSAIEYIRCPPFRSMTYQILHQPHDLCLSGQNGNPLQKGYSSSLTG